jgi:hypothetical protein
MPIWLKTQVYIEHLSFGHGFAHPGHMNLVDLKFCLSGSGIIVPGISCTWLLTCCLHFSAVTGIMEVTAKRNVLELSQLILGQHF